MRRLGGGGREGGGGGAGDVFDGAHGGRGGVHDRGNWVETTMLGERRGAALLPIPDSDPDEDDEDAEPSDGPHALGWGSGGEGRVYEEGAGMRTIVQMR